MIARIVNNLLADLVDISLNIHGTRALQTLIEKLAKEVLKDHDQLKGDYKLISQSLSHNIMMQIISSLNKEVVELIMDMHGNHVI